MLDNKNKYFNSLFHQVKDNIDKLESSLNYRQINFTQAKCFSKQLFFNFLITLFKMKRRSNLNTNIHLENTNSSKSLLIKFYLVEFKT